MYFPLGILCLGLSMVFFWVAFHPATELQGETLTPGNILNYVITHVKG